MEKLILIIENGNFRYSGAKIRNDYLIRENIKKNEVIRVSSKWCNYYKKNKVIEISFWQLIKILFKRKFNFYLMTDVFLFCLFIPFPVIFTVHDMKEWTQYGRRGKIKKLLFYFLSKKPGVSWIAISDYVANKLKYEIGINSKIVSNSVGEEWFSKAKNSNHIHKIDYDYAIYVSNFAKHKGHEDLLTAVKYIKVKKIILVGVISDKYGEAIYNKLNNHDKFKIIKNVGTEELVELIDSANYILFPSYYEGYGIPIGEAIVRNKPILVNYKLKKYIYNCNLIKFIDFKKTNTDYQNLISDISCNCNNCKWKIRWDIQAKKLSKAFF